MAELPQEVKIKKFVAGSQAPDITSGKSPDSKISNTNTSFFNKSIAQLRSAGGELEAIRQLGRSHGDLSAAVSAAVRLANTELKFRVYDDQHELSEEGDKLLKSILARLEIQFDYTTGFDNRQSLAGLKETLLRSIPMTGACAAELVLDKTRLPFAIKPIPVEKIQWVVSSKADGINQALIPRMNSQKGNIDLDFPTIAYAALDFEPMSAYTFSPLEPAINTSIFYSEIVEDIRRVITKTGHSRLVVKLNYEELVKSSPLDIRSDAQKLGDWVEGIRQSIQKEIEGLKPESALVTFTSVEADYLNSAIGSSADYSNLMMTIDAILSTSMKTPASVLGKPGAGSQNTASVESLLFLKNAMSLHPPVETVLCRLLTLACRLVGFSGYVKPYFVEPNLRPAVECESFVAMRQAKILEQLSLGFLTDAQAAQELGTGALSPTFQPLSGTQFYGAKPMGDTFNANQDTATRAVTTDKKKPAPKNSGGKDNSSKP